MNCVLFGALRKNMKATKAITPSRILVREEPDEDEDEDDDDGNEDDDEGYSP